MSNNNITVDTAEDVTYLTKTAFADGLSYLQDNFLTKDALSTSNLSDYTYYMSNNFVGCLERRTYYVTVSASRSYSYFKIYDYNYSPLWLINAYAPNGMVTSYNLSGTRFFYDYTHQKSGTSYIKFEFLFLKVDSSALAANDEDAKEASWSTWNLVDGYVYATDNSAFTLTPVGQQDQPMTFSTEKLIYSFSSDARNYPSKANDFFINGYVARLESNTMTEDRYVKSIKWGASNTTNITMRWIALYDFYNNEETLIYSGAPTATKGTDEYSIGIDYLLEEGHELRIYGNGVYLTYLSLSLDGDD